MNNLHTIQVEHPFFNIPGFKEAVASWNKYAWLTNNERRLKIKGERILYYQNGEWEYLHSDVNAWMRTWHRIAEDKSIPNLPFSYDMVIVE